MTHHSINLQDIDFSQSDGEFILKGQIYQLKQHLGKYFFRKKLYKASNFIYSSFLDYFFSRTKSYQKTQNSSIESIESVDLGGVCIQRCIQYKNTIFCFNYYKYGCHEHSDSWGEYCSLKFRHWIPFMWKPCSQLNLDDILEQPDEFFIKQATTAYHPYFLKIHDEVVHPSLRTSYKFKGERLLEFIRGSESELRRLTQVVVVTLTELKLLFEQYSSLRVFYESNYDDRPGGFTDIRAGYWRAEDWYDKEMFSRQAQQLFELIFDNNSFTGFNLQFEEKFSRSGFDYYSPHPYALIVEVQAPSQHERLEASLELQSWLQGKLSEEEIKSYFEGTYAVDPPNPLKKRQINIDNTSLKSQQINVDDIPF